MSDENGPYKLVQKHVRDATQAQEVKYCIVLSAKDSTNGEFLKEVVPDPGDMWMARRLLKLLNKEWQMERRRAEIQETSLKIDVTNMIDEDIRKRFDVDNDH